MARQTLILAKNSREAGTYAKSMGLKPGTYRAVRNAAAIRASRRSEIHLLPSFLKRPDRHSIMSALRYARGIDIFYVDPADLAVPTYVVDLERRPKTPAGPTLRELEVAHRYDRLRDLALGKLDSPDFFADRTSAMEVMSDEAAATEEPAPEAPRRRRTRCKDCSQLHFAEDSCPAPAQPVAPTPGPVSFF